MCAAPYNGSALSCEPQRRRGSPEAPEFDAKLYHGPIERCCGSAAAAPCWAAPLSVCGLLDGPGASEVGVHYHLASRAKAVFARRSCLEGTEIGRELELFARAGKRDDDAFTGADTKDPPVHLLLLDRLFGQVHVGDADQEVLANERGSELLIKLFGHALTGVALPNGSGFSCESPGHPSFAKAPAQDARHHQGSEGQTGLSPAASPC